MKFLMTLILFLPVSKAVVPLAEVKGQPAGSWNTSRKEGERVARTVQMNRNAMKNIVVHLSGVLAFVKKSLLWAAAPFLFPERVGNSLIF